MRTRLLLGALVGAVVFLLVTNPAVVDAARQVTGSEIKNGSVTSKDIKDGSLHGPDFKDGSVRSADLADGSVRRQDLAAGVVTGQVVQLRSFAGAIGDTGPEIRPFSFLGPTVHVYVGVGQSVVASGTATLGVDAGSTTADVAMCFLPLGVQAAEGPRPLGGANAVSNGVAIGTGRTVVAASGSQSFNGDLNVGMCVRSGQTGPVLNNNDTAAGYVEVVDTQVVP